MPSFTAVMEFMLLSRRAERPKKKCVSCFNGALLCFSSSETEYPVFVKEPPTHISAEMEKVVDIPCQARGECFFFSSSFFLCAVACVKEQKA